MALPSPLVGATVRATRIAADGSAVAGAIITLTPTVPAQSPAGDVLVSAVALPKTTDSGGLVEWTAVLLTDSPGLSNRVPYTVTVVESNRLVDSYVVELLATQVVGGVIRLDDVPHATPPVPLASYMLASAVGAVAGPAGPLDGSGKIPVAQIPAQGSVPDATASVKGVLQLTGDLSGTAASPTVPGLVGKANTSHSHIIGDVTGLSAALAGTQPLDADLTTIAGLAPADDSVLQRKAGAWTGRTPAQLKTDLVLGAVDNTSDANKPVSTAQQTALDGKVALATVDAKGDLYAGTADNTVGRLAAGTTGQVLTADSAQATGLRWAPTARAGIYRPEDDNLIGVVGDPVEFWDQSTLGAPAWLVRVPVPAGQAITGCVACLQTAGVHGTGGENSFAVWSYDGATLLGSTTTDDTLWEAAGPRRKALTAPVAATNTDRLVYVEVRVTYSTTQPVFVFARGPSAGGSMDGIGPAAQRRAIVAPGGARPALFNPATYGSSSTGYCLFVGLY